MLGVVVHEADLFLLVDLQEPSRLLTNGAEIDTTIGRLLPRLASFAARLRAAVPLESRLSSFVPERGGTVAVSCTRR